MQSEQGNIEGGFNSIINSVMKESRGPLRGQIIALEFQIPKEG